MPIDVRKLIFNKNELRQAFTSYCKGKGIPLPDSPMEDFDVITGERNRVVSENMPEGLKVVLRFVSSDPHNPFRVHLSEPQVMEALISACRIGKIPLPRRGNKYVQAHKGSLALTIGMNEGDVVTPRQQRA